MATGLEILASGGEAGLGSNASIPAIATNDLDVVNRTADRLLMANLAQNQELYQQKLRERDQLLQEIDSGSIKVGDLLEQDMPVVKEGLQKLDDAYFARIKKGINDLDAAREYKKALREAQDRVTQAQARKVFYDSTVGQISKETLPRKQKAMNEHLQKTINGGFFKDLTPYQQSQDLDIQGSILSTAQNITEQYTDPKNPLMKGKRTLFDYDKTLQANKTNFLNDVDKRYDQQQLMNAIQSLPEQDFIDNLTAINNRIIEYNQTKGLQPGQPGYVTEIDYEVDPQTGQAMIRESLPDFAAKYTLANQKPFGAVETQFDKDMANYLLGQERNRIAEMNAKANQQRAAAYAALQRKKLNQLTEQEKQIKNFWGQVTSKVKERMLSKNGVMTQGDYVFVGDLPPGYQNVGGLDPTGKPIPLTPKQTPKGVLYYDTKFYDIDGNEVDLKGQYEEYRKLGGKETYNDLRNKLINSGNLNMELVGANGVANFETAFQTARALSNKIGSGKEEPVFGEEVIQEIE